MPAEVAPVKNSWAEALQHPPLISATTDLLGTLSPGHRRTRHCLDSELATGGGAFATLDRSDPVHSAPTAAPAISASLLN